MSEKFAVWELKVPEKVRVRLKDLKDASMEAFKNESDNYKQKLVFDLLEAAKNKDQNRFFYLLLKAINKPKEKNFEKLWKQLSECYDILPEEAFINFAYSIIIGIMSTYDKSSGGVENESE